MVNDPVLNAIAIFLQDALPNCVVACEMFYVKYPCVVVRDNNGVPLAKFSLGKASVILMGYGPVAELADPGMFEELLRVIH